MFLLIGAFMLAFIFLDPLYELVVLALVLVFGYTAKALENLRRIWFILLTVGLLTTVLWSLVGAGRTPLILFVELESVLYGLSIALRLDTTIIVGVIFLSTTRNEEVAIGLVKLGIPYRFAFAVTTALRLVPTIASTGYTISQAQRSRGLDLDSGNILQRTRKYVPLLVPVFVTTIRSTNVFSMALESKGFGAGGKRTSYLQTALGRRDAVVLIMFVAILAAAIALRVAGYGGLEGFVG
jgi:energy-coupling factor transport system permease protein